MKFKINRVFLIITISILTFGMTACSYFYPFEVKTEDIPLLHQKRIDLSYITVTRGNIFEGYTLGIDGQSQCLFVDDPKKTVTANAGIGAAYVKKLYAKEGDYVHEGDILVEYEYIPDKDAEFALNLNKDRAYLKYENALLQYQKGLITLQSVEIFRDTYYTASLKLDDYNGMKEKYVLNSPATGYIAGISDYSPGFYAAQDLTFYICEKKDGYILIYALSDIEGASYPLLLFKEGASARVSDPNTDFSAKAYVKMTNSTFVKEFFEDSTQHRSFVYMVVAFEDAVPDEVEFNRNYTVSLINKEVIDVLIIPIDVVETDIYGNTYVYKITDNETTELTYITIGEQDSNNCEVVSGLDAGDRVLIR